MNKTFFLKRTLGTVLALSLAGLAGCAKPAADSTESPAIPVSDSVESSAMPTSAPAESSAALSAGSQQTDTVQEPADEGVITADSVTWDMNTDFVVVGAGMSGLTAAVEALNQDKNVIVLESRNTAGGNGTVTSCVMGVGTRFQDALGIELTPAQIITLEMETFNYSVDGTRWSKVIQDSADNIDWLIDQGCLMMEDFVDNYNGTGVYDTAHWWVGETKRDGGNGFVTPMVNRIEELGGTILYETPGQKLVVDDSGAVAGICAQSADGPLYIEAKTVILATGGFADNDELIAQMGYNVEETEVFGMPGHNGDGITMALAAGGKSWLDNASLMEYPMNPKLGRNSSSLSRNPSALWVNGDGLRFVDENCSEKVPGRAAQAVRSQEITYAVFDQALMDEIAGASTDNAALVEIAVDDGSIFKADTLEELAVKAGIDPEAFIATVKKYNVSCENGEDIEFGKKAGYMKALTTAPYYMSKNSGIYFLTTIGGLDTTPYGEVRSAGGGVVSNLYAVGVDGVALYKGLYTIDIPGSCNANNIWSGRTAVRHACGLK